MTVHSGDFNCLREGHFSRHGNLLSHKHAPSAQPHTCKFVGLVGWGGEVVVEGVPPPAPSLVFWCEATKPCFMWRKVETVKEACVRVWSSERNLRASVLSIVANTSLFFFNLWSHFILVKFKYGQMLREVHSVVINRASNWLICHLEAVFVCSFTK